MTADELTIEVAHLPGGAIVGLSGRVNIESSPALRARLLAILTGEPAEPVTVDLGEVSYIDCSGIATLIEALKVAREHRTAVHLKGLHDRLLHLFDITGVLSLFNAAGDKGPATEPKAV